MPPKKQIHVSTKRKSSCSNTIDELATKGSMRRVARKGGVKRMTHSVLPEMQAVLHSFVKSLITDVIFYAESAKRSTVVASDVIHALRKRGKHLYGYT